jgi:hypothetical protein
MWHRRAISPTSLVKKAHLPLRRFWVDLGGSVQLCNVVAGNGVASSGVDGRDSIEEGLRRLRRRRSRKDLPLPVVTRTGYRRCHSGTVQPAPEYNGCPPPFTFTAYDHRHDVCCDVCHHSYLTPDSGLPLHLSRKTYRHLGSHTLALKAQARRAGRYIRLIPAPQQSASGCHF